MYIEKLIELNKSELRELDGNYKYIISTYEDVTEIKYLERNKEGKFEERETYTIPSCYDIQLCEKIIEMRKAFKD